jgi:hypothetical protein
MARQCSSRFERAARQLGWTRIAGIDEAGRGALFGPVVAAAVILNPKRRIVGLDDSKKLTAERRSELAPRIREHALAWAVAEVDASRIDAWNVYQASRQAMTAALQQLSIVPDYLLIDAMQLDVLIEQESLIKGDAKSILHRCRFDPSQDAPRFGGMNEDGLFRIRAGAEKGYGTPGTPCALSGRRYPASVPRAVREAGCWSSGATQTPLPIF